MTARSTPEAELSQIEKDIEKLKREGGLLPLSFTPRLGLRDSTIGNRVVVSVVGAFIYQLIQDLSSGIFISYGLTTILGIILPSVLLIVASMISFKKI